MGIEVEKLVIFMMGLLIGFVIYASFKTQNVYQKARQGLRQPSSDCKENK